MLSEDYYPAVDALINGAPDGDPSEDLIAADFAKVMLGRRLADIGNALGARGDVILAVALRYGARHFDKAIAEWVMEGPPFDVERTSLAVAQPAMHD